MKSELQLACELVRLLDGLPIEQADNALVRARNLLPKTQVVSARSPLLIAMSESEEALQGSALTNR